MTNNIYFIANWKMYGSISSLNSLNKLINLSKLKKYRNAKIIYFPPFTLIQSFINKFKNMQEPNQLLFLGISNSAAVFLLNGLKLLNHINKELKNHTNNATINRIILTDKLDKKSPLKICPTPTSGSFVLSPNYNPPASKTKYNNHIAVYYTKEPEKFYYPIE